MRRTVRTIAVLSSILGACHDAARSGRDASAETTRHGPGDTLAVMLGDSVAYENEMTSGFLHRVLVRNGPMVDTIPGVLVQERPMVAGDSTVIGVRYEEDRAIGLFVYDRRTRRTQVVAPPSDWWVFATPALSPDGRHLAYLARDQRGRGYGVVAAVPSWHPRYAGPPVEMLETDMPVDMMAWLDAARFEMRIALTWRTGGEQRIRGAVGARHVVIDTVPDTSARP